MSAGGGAGHARVTGALPSTWLSHRANHRGARPPGYSHAHVEKEHPWGLWGAVKSSETGCSIQMGERFFNLILSP